MKGNIFPFYYSAFCKYDFIYFVKMLNCVLPKQNIMSDNMNESKVEMKW